MPVTAVDAAGRGAAARRPTSRLNSVGSTGQLRSVLFFAKHTRQASAPNRGITLKPGGFFLALQFCKPALPYDKQADLLLRRGLVADRDRLISRLRAVGYYRLCAYWHPFKQPDDTFRPQTTLDVVWERYTFDRQLRLAVMDAIERVEVAVRTALSTHSHCKAGRLLISIPRRSQVSRANSTGDSWMTYRNDAQRSSEVFVEHFKSTYDEFPDLPLWAAGEIMTFGMMFTLFRMSGKHVQVSIGSSYKLSGPRSVSWLLTLNYVRNLCAHHSRLWNRELEIKPMNTRLEARPALASSRTDQQS